MQRDSVIKSLLMFPTGTHNQQVSHAYTTHLTPGMVRELNTRTYGGQCLEPGAYTGVAGGMLILDPSSQRAVDVSGGFNEPRIRFVMQVVSTSAASSTLYIYSGYTDHYGYSQGGHVDPNMRLFFNNCIAVTQLERVGPNGIETVTNVNDCTHLLHSNLILPQHSHLVTPQQPFNQQLNPTSLTPTNMLYNMSIRSDTHMLTEMNQYLQDFGSTPGMLIDGRLDLSLSKAKRSSVIPSYYMSESTKAYSRALENQNQQGDIANIYNSAASMSQASSPYTDRFLGVLALDHDFEMNGCITWATLIRAYPEVDSPEVTNMIRHGSVQSRNNDVYMATASNYDPLIGDQRLETLLVQQLFHTVTPILLQNLIGNCTFNATNMVMTGGYDVSITGIHSYVGLPNGALMDRVGVVKGLLEELIFRDLGTNNQVPIDLQMTINAFGESFAKIRYNGGYELTYTSPSYADAVTTPILATNHNPLNVITNDFSSLFNSMG